MALIHKYTLVCDEIRREDNGKLMIIGLYTPGLVLPKFPAQLSKLTFMNYLDVTAPGTWDLAFKLNHTDTGAIVSPEGRAKVEVSEIGVLLMPIVIVNVNFQMPGNYTFTLTGANFDGVTLTVPVSQRAVATVH